MPLVITGDSLSVKAFTSRPPRSVAKATDSSPLRHPHHIHHKMTQEKR